MDANPNGPGLQGSCPFGWWGLREIDGSYSNPAPVMEHDRWYPTLTTLRDGRVLISGGWSIVAGGNIPNEAVRSGLLEVYDPVQNTIDSLSNAEFPVPNFPVYPFMYEPGKILKAGGPQDVEGLAAAETERIDLSGRTLDLEATRLRRLVARCVRAWRFHARTRDVDDWDILEWGRG